MGTIRELFQTALAAGAIALSACGGGATVGDDAGTGADTDSDADSDADTDTDSATDTDTGSATDTDTDSATDTDTCADFDYCLNELDEPVAGCGETCGGIEVWPCPSEELVCVNEPFPAYDEGSICVPPHALECDDESDCQCLPDLDGCWADCMEPTIWSCEGSVCTADCTC